MNDQFLVTKNFLATCLATLIASGSLCACSQTQTAKNAQFIKNQAGIIGGEKVDVASDVLAQSVVEIEGFEGQDLPSRNCTGTLIGESVVLTAAHCVRTFLSLKLQPRQFDPVTKTPLKLEFPAIIVRSPNGDSSSAAFVSVTSGYDPILSDHDDIALIKLAIPLALKNINDSPPFKIKVDKIGLAQVRAEILVMGYGLVKLVRGAWFARDSEKSDGLQKKTLEVIAPESSVIKDELRVEVIPKTVFFASPKGKPKGSACHGDSGGPVIIWQGQTPYVVGVVWKRDPNTLCTSTSAATRVSSYVPWIENQVESWGVKIF